MAILIVSLSFAAGSTQSDNVIDKEQNLVNNVEMQKGEAQNEAPSSFWDKMTSIYQENANKSSVENIDLNEPETKEIGEQDGFWTRIKKAFAYSTQPKKRSSKRDAEINVLMIEGREYYRNGEYRKSLNTFKEVVQRDPYNITARRYIRTCQEELNKITLDDFDIVKKERLQDLAKTWLIKSSRQKEIESVINQTGGLSQRLIDKNIEQVIPSIQFVDAQLPVVFEHLFQISDPKVSIVTDPEAIKQLEEAKNDTITLKLSNIPMIDVIKYICKVKGLTYRVDDSAVVINSKANVTLKRKVFQLSRSLDMIDLPDVEGSSNKKVTKLLEKIGIPTTEGATVTYDTRNNRLIVRNTDANLKIIEEFIKRFSKTPFQVQIQSRFVTIRSDNMSQLVFRQFLTKNYRWDRNSKYGDRFYLTAPNAQKEMTPGLRYIRSFMNENTYNPVDSAYKRPNLVSTGDAYEDYMRKKALRPQMPGYLQKGVYDIESAYSSIEQQRAYVVEQQQKSSAEYNAYQNMVKTYSPLIAQGGPLAPVYQQQLNDMYSSYTTTVSSAYLPGLNTLSTYRQNLDKMNAEEKTVNDPLGKIFDVSGVIGPAKYRSVIYALDNAEGIHTIFAPEITVLNGQRGEIKSVITLRYNKTIEEAEDQDVDVGDAYSVVYDYAVTPKEWDSREYGTRLYVTPSVKADNQTIELDINPEVSDLIGFRQFVSSRNNVYELPQFFVQSLKTTVLVNDGDTIVMGGLMHEQLVKTNDKIPIFGDLPLIGRFFRGESEVSKKSNLLVFLTAKLIDPSGQTRHIASAK
ncbi:MAG: hypothetical protein DRI44_03775 [Chlamydiae bacterium]|nr:MAG: hypothetical protein DRI44_03775 [Chlamydiota bacterium]